MAGTTHRSLKLGYGQKSTKLLHFSFQIFFQSGNGYVVIMYAACCVSYTFFAHVRAIVAKSVLGVLISSVVDPFNHRTLANQNCFYKHIRYLNVNMRRFVRQHYIILHVHLFPLSSLKLSMVCLIKVGNLFINFFF